MKKQTSNYFILILLIGLCILPGVLAYVFYTHPTWLTATRTNKGVLMAHPVALPSVEGKGKWRIIFWTPDFCDAACQHQLDTLARVRLALGRKLYEVEQVMLLPQTSVDVSEALMNELNHKDFKVNHLAHAEELIMRQVSAVSAVFIMNPDNYLVLSYEANVNPEDIYKDLKTLLNTSATKKG